MKLWDDTPDSDDGRGVLNLFLNGSVEADRCSCGGVQDEQADFIRGHGHISVLVCRECNEKVHGGEVLDSPRELDY